MWTQNFHHSYPPNIFSPHSPHTHWYQLSQTGPILPYLHWLCKKRKSDIFCLTFLMTFPCICVW
jgi:hypothetical protein